MVDELVFMNTKFLGRTKGAAYDCTDNIPQGPSVVS